MYVPLQACTSCQHCHLFGTKLMNTVCRSYRFLMSMLGVYLSESASTDLCKGEEILIQFSNKA